MVRATVRAILVCAIPLGLLGLAACQVPGDPRGALDAVNVVARSATASGWALDDDAPTVSIRVEISVDGRVAWSGTADTSRPDIDVVAPGAGEHHGYVASFSVPPGPHQVCAAAINVGPGLNNTQLGCTVAGPVDSAPFGVLDLVVKDSAVVGFTGWAIDPDVTDPTNVFATIDGLQLAQEPANIRRDDLGQAFPGFGSDHAFDGVIAVPFAKQLAGTGTLCVTAINIFRGQDTLLGCRTLAQATPVDQFNDPTYLHGQILGVSAPVGGSVNVVGRLFDDFNPPYSRGIYVHTAQSVAGGFRVLAADVTDDAGNSSTTISGLRSGLNRICLGGYESYGSEPIARTIDCVDLIVP